MPVYFTSDVHLRLDRPARARRLARWVNTLADDDTLWIAGDLCDFWFATRQSNALAKECPGLRALAEFRARGGSLNVIPGNHDFWLGAFYERFLDAHFAPEPVDFAVHALRIRLVHGHLLGARRKWKAAMETRTFFQAFAGLPAAVANPLDVLLNQTNDTGRARSEARHLRVFRRYAEGLAGSADLLVIGHVHRQVDELTAGPRLVVLGGWHERTNYLKIDESGLTLQSASDPDESPD